MNAMRYGKFLTVIFAVLSAAGCASMSMEGKFTGTKSANISAFADQTIAMLANADLSLMTNHSIYVRPLIDNTQPEEVEFARLLEEWRNTVRGIVRYSIMIVTIAETEKTDKDRVKAYVDYLKRVQESAEKALDLESGHYDQIVAEVGKQEKFIEALQQAQPLINAAGRATQLLMDKISSSAEALANKLGKKIDVEYAEVISYQSTLNQEKYSILRALANLYLTYKGDPAAYSKLVESGTVTDKRLLPRANPTGDQLIAIREHLMKRLGGLDTIWKEVEPDWQIYRATHKELNDLRDQTGTATNRMRVLVLVWLRAHQKMAAGVVNPASWFDIESAPAQLFKLGTKGVL